MSGQPGTNLDPAGLVHRKPNSSVSTPFFNLFGVWFYLSLVFPYFILKNSKGVFFCV
jgi:hypothetical protein